MRAEPEKKEDLLTGREPAANSTHIWVLTGMEFVPHKIGGQGLPSHAMPVLPWVPEDQFFVLVQRDALDHPKVDITSGEAAGYNKDLSEIVNRT